LIEIDHLELTDENALMVGLEGEKIINRYDFLAVFEKRVEYSVRYGSQEIGSVGAKYPVDEVFVLAGMTWIVTDVDDDSCCIYVDQYKGISTNVWRGGFPSEVHTKLMKTIKNVLESEERYAYLSEEAAAKLNGYRFELQNSGVLDKQIVLLTDGCVGIFPWIGMKAMQAMCLYFRQQGFECGIVNGWNLPLYLKFDNKHNINDITGVYKSIKQAKINKNNFSIDKDHIPMVYDKYDKYVDKNLLAKEFIDDFVDTEDLQNSI
jgi:ATP-dependent Lhr-like helicase